MHNRQRKSNRSNPSGSQEDRQVSNNNMATITMEAAMPRSGVADILRQYSIQRNSTQASSIEATPKLPQIHIGTRNITVNNNPFPNVLKDSAALPKPKDEDNARVKINYIARDAALNLLQQYSKLVSVNSLGSVDIPSQDSKSTKHTQGSKVPKRFEKTGRRHHVFTEGLSSISRRQLPSFSMPKDQVVRANLPADIHVDKHGDQFAMSVNQKYDNSVNRKSQDSPKFKQIKMLGLENLPSIDLAKYGTKKPLDDPKYTLKSKIKSELRQNTNSKIQKHSMVNPNSYGASPGKKLTRNLSISTSSSMNNESLPGSQRSSNRTKHGDHRRRLRPLTRHLVGKKSDNKSKNMMGGSQLSSRTYPAQKQAFLNNEWQARVQDKYLKVSSDRRLPTNSMYSLVPLRYASQATMVPPLNFDDDVPKRYSKRTNEARKFYENSENDGYVYFEADTSRSTSSIRRRRSNRSRTSDSSTLTSLTALGNPPPSFVSSGSDDSPSISSKQSETIKNMVTVQEESVHDTSTPSKQNPGNQADLKPIGETLQVLEDAKSTNMAPGEISPALEDSKASKQQVRGSAIGNVVTLGTDLYADRHIGMSSPTLTAIGQSGSNSLGNGLLMVPSISTLKESRPPIPSIPDNRVLLPEVADEHRGSPKLNESSGILKVKTLELGLNNDKSGEVSKYKHGSPTHGPVISVTSDSGINETIHDSNERSGSEDSYTAFSSKSSITKTTMEFVSPLEVQANAKRQ